MTVFCTFLQSSTSKSCSIYVKSWDESWDAMANVIHLIVWVVWHIGGSVVIYILSHKKLKSWLQQRWWHYPASITGEILAWLLQKLQKTSPTISFQIMVKSLKLQLNTVDIISAMILHLFREKSQINSQLK